MHREGSVGAPPTRSHSVGEAHSPHTARGSPPQDARQQKGVFKHSPASWSSPVQVGPHVSTLAHTLSVSNTINVTRIIFFTTILFFLVVNYSLYYGTSVWWVNEVSFWTIAYSRSRSSPSFHIQAGIDVYCYRQINGFAANSYCW